MKHLRLMKFFLISTVFVFLFPYMIFSQSSEVPSNEKKEVTKLKIEVKGKELGDPVGGALVFVRSEKNNGIFQVSVLSCENGIAKVGNVPRGKVLIQVTAEGWNTFGKKYTLDSNERTIQIELDKESQVNAIEEE